MKRIELILNNEAFKQYLAKTAAKEADRKFCRHDLQHLLDTSRIAYILLLENHQQVVYKIHENLKELVYAAALLHDIGRWVEYETGEDHANVGAELAAPILEITGFDSLEQAIICQAIKEHRGKALERSGIGQVLYQADKLARPCLTCGARSDCYKFEQMIENRGLLEY